MSNSARQSSALTSWLTAAIKDRGVYEVLRGHEAGNALKSDGALAAIWDAAVAYYTNDPEALAVNAALLVQMAHERCIDDKQRDRVAEVLAPEYLEQAVAPANALESLQAATRLRLRHEMADALLRHDDEEYEELSAQYANALTVREAKYELSTIGVEGLLEAAGAKIAIAPKGLNRALGGGMERGEVLLIFGRPGAAKTLECINVVYGCLHAQLRVLYIGNEEASRKLQMRLLSRMSGVHLDKLHNADKAQAAEAIAKAVPIARSRGSDNCIFVHGVTNYPDVERLIDETRADVVVVDQLRHMRKLGSKAELTESLEYAARELRDIANRKNVLGVCVSQAGAEAEGKAVLTLNHLDGSKTGVQGAVDVIVGIGVTDELRSRNQRVLSICRNKTSGIITHFICDVNEQTTTITSQQ
jgi:KaiC/GvpD/RAD55 family RecA-like ATPase